MQLRILWSAVVLVTYTALYSQVVTCIPVNPTVDDTITLTFHTDRGNRALLNHEGTIYFHTGVITGTPFEPSGWRFVQGNWGEDDPRVRMVRIDANTYQARFHIRSFYGLPKEETFLQMGLVFRDVTGTIVGKAEDESDIYYPAIQKHPNGPLELADGRDGDFIQKLPQRETLFDGRLFLSNGRQSVSVSKYPGGIANIVFQPGGGTTYPISEAVIIPPDNASIFKEIQPKQSENRLQLGELDLRIYQDPFTIGLVNQNKVILELAEGFFYDDQDPLLGGVSGLRIKLKDGEEVYGGGSRAISTNRRGERFYLYNTANYGYTYGETALNISIPFFISSAGYGLLIDSYRPGYVDFGKTEEGVWEMGIQDTLLSIFVIPGDNPAAIVKKFTALTGRQPLPPLWALGYIQSRFGYRTQTEALAITQKTLNAGIPLDAILIDLYWFGDKDRMGDFTWKLEQWPDPKGMVRTLEEQDIKTILISESYFIKGTRYWNSLVEQDLLATNARGEPFVIPDFWAGPAGILDVFMPEARAWFWERYKDQMETVGIHGWWCDSGEPENHPPSMLHAKGSARQVHNLYSNYWSKILEEGYKKDFPDRRLFNLNRSGTTGMQRYSVFPWSGDVSRSWEAFRAQVPIMLGAGLVGIPYMHSDLGGFTGGPKDEELYVRWVQMGTFVPIMRIHGDATGIQPEPIFFSKKTLNRVRDAIQLRYRLLPYTYTLAKEAYETGLPLARSIVFESLNEEAKSFQDQQYYWGEDLLIAPILKKGAKEKAVYLPAGIWYDFISGERFKGGQMVTLETTLDRIPVLAKAGAWIPQNLTSGNSQQWEKGHSSWRVFLPRENGTISDTAFVDDGLMPETLENGHYTLFIGSSQLDDDLLTLQVKQLVTSRSDIEGERVSIELIGLEEAPLRVKWQGKNYNSKSLTKGQPDSACFWDSNSKVLRLQGAWEEGKNKALIRIP